MPIAPFRSVTVFGGSTIDRIATSHATPIMAASNPGRLASAPGGVGFNIAIALARLGMTVRLTSRVGDDGDGRSIVATAESTGVDTRFVGRSCEQPTASYLASLDPAGDLIVGIAATDINDEMTPAAVADAATTAPASDLWVIDANLPPGTLAFLVERARANGHPLAALPISPAKAVRLAPILPAIACLFANRREAASLLGVPTETNLSPADLAQRLSQRCRQAGVVVTDADRPLAAVSGGEMRTFAPLPAMVRNVNGAGDALAAATLYGLSLRQPFFAALDYGLAAAAMAVESTDAIPSDLTAEAIEARLYPDSRRAAS